MHSKVSSHCFCKVLQQLCAGRPFLTKLVSGIHEVLTGSVAKKLQKRVSSSPFSWVNVFTSA